MPLYYKCLNVKGDHDEDMADAVVTWLNSQAVTWYDESRPIHKLVPRYEKCLSLKGDCVEKYVPQLVCSVSVLLLKNILVWRNVCYFMHSLPSIIRIQRVLD